MSQIKTTDQLRQIYKLPKGRAVEKVFNRFEKHSRNFIAHSPFLIIGSARKDGIGDVTPRGEEPGFVKIIDDTTLAIPDRPGNNRLDTLSNLIENPAIGLIFLLPGIRETLRVNGTATIIVDDPRLEALAVNDRVPAAGILVKTSEVYFHCGKALLRSRLWDSDKQVDHTVFPTLGQIMADQIPTDQSGDEIDESLEHSYENQLY